MQGSEVDPSLLLTCNHDESTSFVTEEHSSDQTDSGSSNATEQSSLYRLISDCDVEVCYLTTAAHFVECITI